MSGAEAGVRDALATAVREWLVESAAPMPMFRRATDQADGKTDGAGDPVPLPILPR